jgi:hypothetical protein
MAIGTTPYPDAELCQRRDRLLRRRHHFGVVVRAAHDFEVMTLQRHRHQQQILE